MLWKLCQKDEVLEQQILSLRLGKWNFSNTHVIPNSYQALCDSLLSWKMNETRDTL